MTQPTIQQLFDQALKHHQAGRLSEAEALYRQILAQQPQHSGALHHLGVIAHQAGKPEIAVDLIRRAITLRPNYPQAHSNLGNALKDQGELDAAIVAFRQAIAQRPDYAEAYYNLGLVLYAQGKLDEAIAADRQAIALRPNFVEAHINLGSALHNKGQLDEAIAASRRAIALNPGLPLAHNNLGAVLQDKGRFDEAIAAYQQAIALQPNYPEAFYNLGNALTDKGQLDEAVAAHRRAIALQPSYASAHNNLGNALKDQGRLDQAITAYRQAIAIDPADFARDGNLIYTLHFHPGYDALAILSEHRRWNQRHAKPLAASIAPHENDRSPTRRLRVGYISPYLRNHCQSLFTIPLLSNHDHDSFEIFCYSDARRPDAVTQRLTAYADGWQDIPSISDAEVAEQIRRDRIDILVDLTMHMAHGRPLVMARKPAPVQVAWLAYPGTTGIEAIDYRLTDPYLDPPENDGHYSETSIRLPDTFWCYDPLTDQPPVNDLPATVAGHITFGCLNNFCKINEGILDLWAQVLRQMENSRLLLLAAPGSHRQQTIDRLASHGIEAARIQFFPRQDRREYLKLYHRIDVGLDSFPYNGHTTSLDSFWMGVPVVSLVGQTAVSRAGWCQLSNLGLGDLAGNRPEQFVRIAVELAKDLPRLQELRSTLRRRMEQSPLMDAPRFARNVEAAYRRMWQAWAISQSGEERNR